MSTNPDTNALIDAAEEHARAYDDDDRACIQADVMNAFYKGSAWREQRMAAELAHAQDLTVALGQLLEETANALKGTPDARMAHSTHDLPEWGAKARAVAMTFLAATAPGANHIEREHFALALAAWRALYGRDFFETTQALAMLDQDTPA